MSAVLVAGGSGAVGGAVCDCLSRDGRDLLITYRSNREAAELAAERARTRGVVAQVVHVDLSAPDAVVEVAAEGDIDGLVYAAGPRVAMQHVSTIAPSLFAEQMQGDAVAFYNLVHAVLPRLRESRGAVVAVTTTALSRYSVKDILSVAPKAAVQAVVRGVAAEEGRFGVRANCVGVGVLEDGLFGDLVAQGAYSEEFLAAARRNAALRRFGRAVDVGEAVAFLMSPRAGWITGQSLNVDGGYSI